MTFLILMIIWTVFLGIDVLGNWIIIAGSRGERGRFALNEILGIVTVWLL